MAIWQAREGLEALSPFMSAVYQNISEHLDEQGDVAAKIVSIETQGDIPRPARSSVAPSIQNAAHA